MSLRDYTIEELQSSPSYQNASPQDRQKIVGAYFDDVAPLSEKISALDEDQYAKARNDYVKLRASSSLGEKAKSTIKRFAAKTGEVFSRSGASSFKALNPVSQTAELLGMDRVAKLTKNPMQTAFEATEGKLGDVARETTLADNRALELAADVGGEIAGSLPAYIAGGAAAKGINLASKGLQTAARGITAFGVPGAAAAPEGQKLRAGVANSVIGPLSYGMGNIGGRMIPGQLRQNLINQAIPRVAVGAVEGLGSVGEQLLFDRDVDPAQVAIQAGIGIAVGRNPRLEGKALIANQQAQTAVSDALQPPKLGLPEPPRQITADSGRRVDFTQGDREVGDAQKAQIKIQRNIQKDKYDTPEKLAKAVEEFRAASRLIAERTAKHTEAEWNSRQGLPFNHEDILADQRISQQAKADIEQRMAESGDRGLDPMQGDNIDPNAYRGQIRLDEADHNPNVIEQPATPGDIDPRQLNAVPGSVRRFLDPDRPRSKPEQDAVVLEAMAIESVTDQFRLRFDNEVGDRISRTAKDVIDEQMKILGELEGDVNAAQKLMRGPHMLLPTGAVMRGKVGAALGFDELHTFVPEDVGSGYRFEELSAHRYLNGVDPDDNLSETSKKILDSVRRVIQKRGEIAEREGMLVNTGDVPVPFRVKPGEKIGPHVATNELIGLLMRNEDDPSRQAFIRALSKMNDIPIKEVEGYIKSFSKRFSVIDDTPAAMFAHAQFDFQRKFRRVPHRLIGNGESLRLYETNLSNYVESLARTGANTIGFRKAFGQEIGTQTPLTDLKKEFLTSYPNSGRALTTLFRILNGLPMETTEWVVSASKRPSVRMFQSAIGVAKALGLTATAPLNTFETIATAFRQHPKAYAKAIKNLAIHPRTHKAALEALGLHNNAVFNPIVDPDRWASSLAGIMGDLINRMSVVKFANDVNGIIVGQTALEQAKLWQRGVHTKRDIALLEVLGYKKPLATRIATGAADQATYDNVSRRLARSLPGGPVSNAEKSLIENSIIFRTSTAYTSYANQVLRQNLRGIRKTMNRLDAIASDESLTSAQRVTQTAAEMIPVLRAIGLAGASAYGASLMTALATGGGEGVEQFNRRTFNENIAKNFGELVGYQMVVGPYGILWKNMFGDNEELDLLKPIYTASLAAELIEFAKGEGPYVNSPTRPHMIVDLLRRMTPGHKIAKNIVAATGMAEIDIAFDQDVNAFWQYKRDNKLGGGRFVGDRSDTEIEKRNAAFSHEMRMAVKQLRQDADIVKFRESMIKALINGEDASSPLISMAQEFAGGDGSIEKAKKRFAKAIAADIDRFDSDAIAESLRNRKLLTKGVIFGTQVTDEQFAVELAQIKSQLGDEAFMRLVVHDMIMDEWANSWQIYAAPQLIQAAPEITNAFQQQINAQAGNQAAQP